MLNYAAADAEAFLLDFSSLVFNGTAALSGKAASVRDVWRRRTVAAAARGSYTLRVPQYDSALLVLTAAGAVPTPDTER